MPRAHVATVFVILVSTLALPCVRAQRLRVGTLGASIPAGKGWVAKVVDADLPDGDQFEVIRNKGFLRREDAYFLVREFARPVDTEADVEALARSLWVLESDAPVEIVHEAGVWRASRAIENKLNGLRFAFRVRVLGRDGLSYGILGWALLSNAGFLDAHMDAAVSGFAFPGPDSAWAKALVPTTRKVVHGSKVLSFDVRPFVLRDATPEPHQLASLTSADGEHAVYVLLSDEPTADGVLEETLRAIAGEGDRGLVEEGRRDLAVGGATGRLVVARYAEHTYHFIAVPVGMNRFLDIRYAARGRPEDARFDRDLFLRTLKLADLETRLELPPLGPAPNGRLSLPGRAGLRGVSRRIMGLPARFTRARVAGGGAFLVQDGRGALLVRPDGSAEVVCTYPEWGWQCVVGYGDGWLIARDGIVKSKSGDRIQELPWRADWLAASDDALWILRRAEPVTLPGVGDVRPGEIQVTRRVSDRESLVSRLDDDTAHGLAGPYVAPPWMVLDDTGKRVLVVTDTSQLLPGPRRGAVRLRVVSADGRVQNLEGFERVEDAIPTEGGWLVTGASSDGRAGLFLVVGDRAPSLLLAQVDITGVALEGDVLTYVDADSTLWTVEIPALKAAGLDAQPFTPRSLGTLGRRVREQLRDVGAPRTEAEIRAALDAADDIARESMGATVPRSAEELDALFAFLIRGGRTSGAVTADARLVLALALVASYLDRGASWVEPETAAWSDWSAHTPAIPPTLLAQASTPGTLVWSALDDDEGTWTPATALVREGREAILGLDRASLQEHLAADTAEDVFEALETGTATAILAVLERRRENHVLRTFVYDQLQGRAQFQLLEPWLDPSRSVATPGTGTWFAGSPCDPRGSRRARRRMP